MNEKMTEQEFCEEEHMMKLWAQAQSGELLIHDLRHINVELTEKVLYRLFELAELIGKTAVRKEVAKQTENLLYWVNR